MLHSEQQGEGRVNWHILPHMGFTVPVLTCVSASMRASAHNERTEERRFRMEIHEEASDCAWWEVSSSTKQTDKKPG